MQFCGQFRGWFRRVAFVTALGSSAAGMGCATSGPNKGDFNLISVEQERQMGEQVHEQVEQEMQLVDDPEAVAYLEDLGKRLARSAPDTPFEFEFHIVKDAAVNAFATPGGHVYINTGLIEAVASEAELAGVVAHEMGHVVFRHGSEQLTKAYGLNMVASLALGQEPGLLKQLAAQIGGTALMLKYSRNAEREADEVAVESLHGAGIDPRGIVKFFETLQAGEEGAAPPRFLAWLSTHPLTDERIKDSRKMIAGLPEKSYRSQDGEFRRFQERVTDKLAGGR